MDHRDIATLKTNTNVQPSETNQWQGPVASPRSGGENSQLEAYRSSKEDPIQLAWMVNQVVS